MHHQKLKKKLPKKRKQKKYKMPSHDCSYQADNPLTIYFAKYINKDGKVKLHMSNGQKTEEMASDLAKLI